MTEYITIAQVDGLLGSDWTTEDKKARAVLMANTWLSAKPLPAFEEVPAAVVQAGAEIAREAAAGALYGATETGVLSKSVEADGVSSSKTYSSSARKVSAGEAFALALLAPLLGPANQVKMVRGVAMGLRDELTADLAEAFDTDLADAVSAFTGSRQVEGAYDPVTGEDASTAVTYAGRGVFGSYRNDEIDGGLILATDTKLTALQAELFITENGERTASLAAPEVGDTINGMRAQRISKDPAGATWSVQLRK